MVIIASFFAFVFVLVLFAVRKRNQIHQNLPPGSSGWPILGESIEFLRARSEGIPEKFIQDRVERYGSHVFRTCLLGEPMAVLCGPAGNKLIFSNEGKNVALWWPKSVQQLIAESLISKSGEEGRVYKKMLMSFFNMDELVKYIPVMEEVTRLHLDTQWQAVEELKVYLTMKHYTFEIACRLFMSITEPELISRLFSKFNLFIKGVISIPLDIPGTRYFRACRAANAIRLELREVVSKRRADLEKKTASPNQDILSHLLVNADENGKFMPEIEVINNVLNLLFAGHDTSTSALTLVMKYLAELPRVYGEVLREQMEIAASKAPGELLNWEDLQRMRYSWNVVCEVMRMSPPITGSFREALVDIEFEGYTIPRGWKMLWSAPFTHKDPDFYPRPTEFDESRFQGSGPPPFSYVPFGGGPRMCLGMEFARLQILVFLHNIITRFKWNLCVPNEKIAYDPMPTPVHGLPIRLQHKKLSG